jgi:hypothetical protein
MSDPTTLQSQRPGLLDPPVVSATADLSVAVPPERRDMAARRALLRRIRGEFREMPGLLLTAGQGARLFGLPPAIAARILERLTDASVLRQMSDGQFALRIQEL